MPRKQTSITKSARGEECQVRIIGVCNGNPKTTVFAHLGGGGMGMKSNDIHGAYCCSDCHDVVDNRAKTSHSRAMVALDFFDGMVRTQLILIEKGLIKIAGENDEFK